MKKFINNSIVPTRRELGSFGSLQSEINSLFDDFFSPFDPVVSSNSLTLSPKMDVVENDKDFEVNVDLPGLKDSDIDVSIKDGVLTIKGETSNKKEDKNKNYYMCERHYGSFHRSVALSKNIDESKADASFKDGVLSIIIPKKEEDIKTTHKLKIRKE